MRRTKRLSLELHTQGTTRRSMDRRHSMSIAARQNHPTKLLDRPQIRSGVLLTPSRTWSRTRYHIYHSYRRKPPAQVRYGEHAMCKPHMTPHKPPHSTRASYRIPGLPYPTLSCPMHDHVHSTHTLSAYGHSAPVPAMQNYQSSPLSTTLFPAPPGVRRADNLTPTVLLVYVPLHVSF